MGTSALKRGIEEMVNDPEIQERIAQETGDPNLLADFQHGQAPLVSREFRRINPSYVKSRQNWARLVLLVQCVAFNCLQMEPDEASAAEMQELL